MIELEVRFNTENILNALDKLERNIEGIQPMIVDHTLWELREACMLVCPSPTSTHYQTNSSGTLRDSHEVVRIDPLSGMVKPTAFYAVFVHNGTLYIPARPWLELAASQAEQSINAWIQGELQRIAHQSLS